MTPQMLKRLKKKISNFEIAVSGKDFMGTLPAEYHDEIISNYENAKQELIDLVEIFTNK